jgi:hypothetical protein
MSSHATPLPVQTLAGSRRGFLGGLLGAASVSALAACGSGGGGGGARVAYPQYTLPQYAYRSAAVREGYTFAIEGAANRAALEAVPCYCHCVDLKHTSLRSCFIKDDGDFDTHAAGCKMCVDEALDVKLLLAAGKPLPEIRRTIDAKYGGSGKPTKTAFPTA